MPQSRSFSKPGVQASSDKGREFEDYVANDLESRGYRILERNFRSRFGEIDIIAQKNGEIALVEVKGRSRRVNDTLSSSINPRKVMRIHSTFRFWLMRQGLSEDAVETTTLVAVVTIHKAKFVVKYINIGV